MVARLCAVSRCTTHVAERELAEIVANLALCAVELCKEQHQRYCQAAEEKHHVEQLKHDLEVAIDTIA